MSLARVATFAFRGLEAVPVEVQVQIAPGLPAFLLVGLPDKAVAESRERVRAALNGMGLSLPPRRVLANLAPADLAKEGGHYDLPLALAVLAAMDLLPRDALAEFAAMGALSLDGAIAPVAGVLAGALAASERDLGLICPAAQGPEAAWAGRIEVLAAADLPALLNHFHGVQVLSPPLPPPPRPADRSPGPCLSDVRGQETARRALEIAAAGGHNLLLVGPAGTGKSMLAARLPGLLPDLGPAEALEVSLVHSVAGLLREGRLVTRPPFREPHHSASQAALAGGGARARPGEITLAHRGVLFLDELPEFPRPALEALRQPLETGRVAVARANGRVEYPARFQLVAAMNPCRCGHLGDAPRECGRAPRCGADYRARLSGPLLDRVDLSVEMAPVPATDLLRAAPGEGSAAVAARVAAARGRQAARAGDAGARNAGAGLAELERGLAPEASALAGRAVERLHLSARAFVRTLRVARTIADLNGEETVRRPHLAEALAFRQRGTAPG